MRIGIDRKNFFPSSLDDDTASAGEEAIREFERLGASIREINIPWLEYSAPAFNLIHMSESHAYHEHGIRKHPKLYGPTVRAYFRLGAFIGSADYLDAQRVRAKIRTALLSAFEEVDLIVSPVAGGLAEPFDQIDTSKRFKRVTGPSNVGLPFSLAGVPTLAIPCGFSREKLPIGMQIAGRPFEEANVFQVAHAYERATPWHDRHPAL